MAPRDTPAPYSQSLGQVMADALQRRRIRQEERNPARAQMEEDRRRELFRQQILAERERRQRQRTERERRERHQRILAEADRRHEELVQDLLNFEPVNDPVPIIQTDPTNVFHFPIPPPPRLQRQEAQRVTPLQNQENIQRGRQQPPPRFL